MELAINANPVRDNVGLRKASENREISNGAKDNCCYDCGKKIEIKGKEIKNGLMLVYDNLGEKINIYKCLRCFKNNPALVNFKKCEVYSRVVGYLRPVRQWHIGKKQEFKERREFVFEN